MSKMFMRPVRRLPAFRPISADPKLCAQLFGDLIRHYRELNGQSIEEVAPSAGLEPEEWLAIEAGQAPDSVEVVLLMATVLRLGDSCLPSLLSYCAAAQAAK